MAFLGSRVAFSPSAQRKLLACTRANRHANNNANHWRAFA
jgi:hypothetical protein